MFFHYHQDFHKIWSEILYKLKKTKISHYLAIFTIELGIYGNLGMVNQRNVKYTKFNKILYYNIFINKFYIAVTVHTNSKTTILQYTNKNSSN